MTIRYTDKELINNVFKALRKNGFIARQNWSSDKFDEEKDGGKDILWTARNSDQYTDDGFLNFTLYVNHDLKVENYDKVLEVCQGHGIEVVWNKSEHRCLEIYPQKRLFKDLRWTKRYADAIETSILEEKETTDYIDRCLEEHKELLETQVTTQSYNRYHRVIRNLRHKGFINLPY